MRKYIWNDTWYFGANFVPSTAINQLEMWQPDTFDPKTIRRELGYAAKIGMNLMRVFLHDLLFEQDPAGFLDRIDEYLRISDSLGIKTAFVFFDDCWNADFQLGKQPDPRPGTHNSGWLESPGSKAADDLSQRPRLERYVKTVMSRFAHDPRIVLWDLYNEPGNTVLDFEKGIVRCNASLPLLKDIFRWAKEVSPDQPFTAAPYNFEAKFDDLNRFMFENSEVISFHAYNPPAELQERIHFMRLIADGRPLLCSEYMARTVGSTFKECLPLLKKNQVSAINWGLVSGKTQTTLPWAYLMETADLSIPFHDIFHADGTFLVPEEEQIFAGLADKEQ